MKTLRRFFSLSIAPFWFAVIAASLVPVAGPAQTRDLVNGNLIQFNDNGAWTWYSDERAIVDPTGGKLVVGSDASGSGLGGSPRNGGVEAALFDLQSGTSQRFTLFLGAPLGCDDHNAPAFMLRPDGEYLSQWTGHNNNYLSYFRIFNGSAWGPTNTFDWQPLGATSSEMASYSNPHYLPAENRTYTFVRSLDIKSMNILLSTNYGDTWTYYGKLNRSYPGSGYNPGYYKFCDNGVDRIDFICTESHPRDTLTSMYHGYISNGMSFKTDGTLVDGNLNDTNAPLSSNFMLVFSNGTVMPPGQTNYRCWNSDVQWYADQTIEAIIHARINQSNHPPGYPDTEDPNHAFFFCRWDGTKWTSTYLCQAGYKLYSAEADYVGLGALSPNDPNTIYLSTKYDPRAVTPGVTDTNPPYSTNREIWQGFTTNHGASFAWRPITQNSVRDNLRPIVPKWDANNTALIWFRGTYNAANAAQNYDAAPVGIVEHRTEVVGPRHYVDATAGAGGNTLLTNGSTLVLSSGANQWHSQAGVGNNSTILSSADAIGETPPMIMTTVTVPGPGTYDLWVNFWGTGTTNADWRILAGINPAALQTYRAEKCEQVQAATQDTSLVLTNTSTPTNYLYQAYVGRAVASVSNTLTVLVGGNAINTGGNGTTLGGSTNRTWYDGISYAKVSPFQITSVSNAPTAVTIAWNSPLTQDSLTIPSYTVWRKNALNDPHWTILVSNLPAAGFTTSYTDNPGGNTAFYRVSWP
ncbi:MAG TPA: BNR-4 repeat-containing protein [Candidatus Acidoferrum sp.]|nr:BNR-4 repeat-containing protein [Candidatus Acidoferrum sp.]